MNFGYSMARHPHWHCHCHCRWSFLRKGEFAQPLIDEEGEEKEEDVAQVFCFHWVLHNVYSWDFCEFSIKSKPATLLTKGFLQLVMPLQHTVHSSKLDALPKINFALALPSETNFKLSNSKIISGMYPLHQFTYLWPQGSGRGHSNLVGASATWREL